MISAFRVLKIEIVQIYENLLSIESVQRWFLMCNLRIPRKKPLGELLFQVKEDGVQLKVPALHERWVKQRCYTKYKGLIINEGKIPGNAATEEWLAETEWFNKDLEYLLRLEHFRFWSHLIYEKKSIERVISFLQEAIPFYMPVTSPTEDQNVVEMYTKVFK